MQFMMLFIADLKKTLNVFCLGTGNIGKTLFQQLQNQMPFLAKNNDLQVKVMGISNTRKMYLNPEGIDLTNWEAVLEGQGDKADLSEFIKQDEGMNLAKLCVCRQYSQS